MSTERITMTTLCRAYTSARDAEAAVDRLIAAGVPGAEIRVLMGAAEHDARDVRNGSFAATATDTQAVGSYAGATHSAREAMGTFAGETGDARRGGFSDVDRDTVTTYADDVVRVRVAAHHDLERMLLDAGLDAASAAADVAALHAGRILVLARGAMAERELAAAIDG
jgi:hypothetical protein